MKSTKTTKEEAIWTECESREKESIMTLDPHPSLFLGSGTVPRIPFQE